MPNKAPVIFDYLDVVQYLSDHFKWRKLAEPKHSYSAWAHELGLGSKTLLRFILQKKRLISAKAASAFRSNLRLAEEEAIYFEALLSYSQASKATERHAYGTALMALQRTRYAQIDLKPNDSAHDVHGPVLLTLLTFKDILWTVETLSEALRTDVATVELSLRKFTEAGLINTNESGQYRAMAEAFRIPASHGQANLRAFHSHWLDQAKIAMDQPAKTRNYRSLKFALTPDEYKLCLERIDEFALTILNQFHTDSLAGRRLYMIENVLFPVSKEPFDEIDPFPQTTGDISV